MYKCILNLYNQVHPTVMKDIVTKKRITKAIFSLKKTHFFILGLKEMAFLNIWLEPIELGVLCYNDNTNFKIYRSFFTL